MSKIEMVKKHLITCSVIFVLVIISRLNIFSTEPVAPIKNSAISTAQMVFDKPLEEAEVAYNFADEALPVNDQKVDFKLKKSIAKHRFKNIQSNVLHAKAVK